MRLLVATTNAGKLREIRTLLPSVDVLTLADVPPVAEPEETGATFDANARLKALYYAAHTGALTVAEDSGLAIDALDGAPGVQSARYLGPDASYAERFDAILAGLAARPDRPRTARFVCAVALAHGDAILYETTGIVEGEIALSPAGTGGFGYDPIFRYPPYDATLAEVPAERKLAVAHRGQAFRALAAWLAAHPQPTRATR